jgi:hypothetical protein
VRLLDTDPGPLQHKLVELEPGGNRVRSFLDAVVPDQSTRFQVQAILDILEHQREPAAFPVVLRFGTTAVRIHMDAPLAAVWRDEISALVEVARACVLSYPGLRVTPRYTTKPGDLDANERSICETAAAQRDTEAVLSLMRQFGRARRIYEIAEVIQLYASLRMDPRVSGFLEDRVPGIFSNDCMPTYGPDVYERFVEWGIANPDWGLEMVAALRLGGSSGLAEYVKRLIRNLGYPTCSN